MSISQIVGHGLGAAATPSLVVTRGYISRVLAAVGSTEQRHYTDELMLSLFLRESGYNTPVPLWSDFTACTMTDVDDQTVHEAYDDAVYGAELIRDGGAAATAQRLTTQSVRINYTEGRAKLNTLAGLFALTLGHVVTQEITGSGFGLQAYLHTLTPALPSQLPSISAQTRHMRNVQTLYPGLKSDGCRLSGSGAFLEVQASLVGSGSRVGNGTPFAPVVVEPWMTWGGSMLYLGNVLTGPLTLPIAPAQGHSSLVGALDIVDISERVISCEVAPSNGLATEHGYRDDSGLVRGNFHAAKPQVMVTVTLYVDLATEADEITRYALQTPMAFEWQWWSSEAVIAAIAGEALTVGTPPEYHTVTDELGGTWYLYPVPTQALEVSATPPAGVALVTGLGQVALTGDRYRYRLGVTSTQQIAVTPISGPHLDEPLTVQYFALRDSDGTTWYIWFSEGTPPDPGTYVISDMPPVVVEVTPGMALVIPKVQWRSVTRGQTGGFDTLTFVGTALLDGVNPLIQGWVINKQPRYLGT